MKLDLRNLVIFAFMLGTLASCCIPFIQKKYYTTQSGSDRPVKSKFELSNDEEFREDNLFMEETIFTKIDSVSRKNAETGITELSVSTSYTRYFETGQYIKGWSSTGSDPALEDYNNLKSGIVGYYKIVGDKIYHEYFLVTAHNCGDYYRSELRIIGDSIEGYQKIKVEGLIGTPDW